MPQTGFTWFQIFRLALVQTALGAVVVLTTSTLNRVMVVELALAASIPGALVTVHHAMQLFRPRMGHGSDLGRRRTPWIIGGMALLALGGVGAAFATTVLATSRPVGLVLAVASFAAIGAGVSAAGTSLLVLLSEGVADARRGAAATLVWMMMIAGFAVTATVAGKQLEPFSHARLVIVASAVSAIAFVVALAAVWGVERRGGKRSNPDEREPSVGFREALRSVWAEQNARRFTWFVFVSMLAYSAQDLVLEPFAGAIFAFSPGASTKLSGVQHSGVFAGMLLVAVMTSLLRGTIAGTTKFWVVVGCGGSAIAMVGLVWAAMTAGSWPLRENVFFLGFANGAFSIAAIAAMMGLAGQGQKGRNGVRMGLWGAAQAIAFGAGGFVGAALCDVVKLIVVRPGTPYAFVFGLEAIGFVAALSVAWKIRFAAGEAARAHAEPAREMAHSTVKA
jgi:BCD family chlorophyll transporter-like MFS transporter